jgi:hypothetical protein
VTVVTMGRQQCFLFIVDGVGVGVNNIGREVVQQWVSATLLQSYKIFCLLFTTINIKHYVCLPIFLPYLSFMQIANFLCRHLWRIWPYHTFPHFINNKILGGKNYFNNTVF